MRKTERNSEAVFQEKNDPHISTSSSVLDDIEHQCCRSAQSLTCQALLLAPFSTGLATMYCLSVPFFSLGFFIYQFLLVNLYISVQYIRIYKLYKKLYIMNTGRSSREILLFILSICQLVFFQSFFFIAAYLETQWDTPTSHRFYDVVNSIIIYVSSNYFYFGISKSIKQSYVETAQYRMDSRKYEKVSAVTTSTADFAKPYSIRSVDVSMNNN